MNSRVLKRFVIICGISTFVMFTVWMLIKSFRDRPPGDYETQICDQRLKDKLWDQAIEQANIALEKSPKHRGAMMCRALVFINKKENFINLINNPQKKKLVFKAAPSGLFLENVNYEII